MISKEAYKINMQSNIPSSLRTMNKSLVLNVVRQHGPISRAQIAQKTNITRATVSGIVSDLLEDGVIYEGVAEESTVGRKGILLHYNDDLGYGIAIDLGGTKISIALFNVNAELSERKVIPTYKVTTSDEFLKMLMQSIRDFISECDRSLSSLKVIGIGTPGIVDTKRGIVIEGSPNLPEWENLNISALIQQVFGVPVVLENDVRAALVGEMWKGQCQNLQNAVLMTLSTGIGSALLMDGNIIRGVHNAAGEIGYMLFERSHLNQDWSKKGCFEMLCSGSGLLERFGSTPDVKEGGLKWSSAADIFRSASNGDEEAVQIIDEFIDYLSIVILNLVFTANPQRVVLMGGIMNASHLFLDKLIHNVNKHTLSHTSVEIVVTELKELAPLYGISLLALNSIQPSITFLNDVRLN
jgi:predicted NBD/HSP70 family sugar kinase